MLSEHLLCAHWTQELKSIQIPIEQLEKGVGMYERFNIMKWCGLSLPTRLKSI